MSVSDVLNRGKSFRSDESFDTSDAAISAAESALGFSFPQTYREFLALGGLNELNFDQRILSPAAIVEDHQFVSSLGLIPFASDGCGGLFCWENSALSAGRVVYWDHETNSIETSFDSFLAAIDSWRRA